MAEKRRLGGPGMLVAAAFVGPGTIATASSAGASFGYALVWALFFSVLATMVLQEMAVRQALVTRQGLATTLRRSFAGSWLGRVAVLLVIAAVGLGNAAYESGNIAGAALALQGIGMAARGEWALLIGAAAAGMLFLPAYRQLERVLIGLVLLMSLVFLFCAIRLAPDWSALAGAAMRPSIPAGSLTTVIALIGTTVVPYNLFLQANAVREKWPGTVPLDQALAEARGDTVLSIGLGGLITLAILSTAATLYFGTAGTFTAEQLSTQLEPVLGPAGRYLFALGLLAAGLTSAVTAPLAAAYAVCGALGWEDSLRAPRFRWVALAVVAVGTFFAATGTRPIAAILFAQAANGLLLPFVALALLYLMNQRELLGGASNGWRGNALAGVVVLVTLGLGVAKLASLFP
jgi:manganese transport protein